MEYISYRTDVLAALNDARSRALLAGGKLVKDDAKLLAPVAEMAGGTLRQSIDYDASEIDNGVVYVGSIAGHSIYVEKGTGIWAEDGNGRKTPWVYYDQKTQQYVKTRGMHKQPFLGPAFENNKSQIIDYFIEELRKLGT